MTDFSLDLAPLGDVRLGPALQVLDREPVAVLSLDVFDTLLWRSVAEPVDAFVLLASELHAKRLLKPTIDALAFARLREAAEAAARRKHSNPAAPEVTLEEIYDEMPEWLTYGASSRVLADAEVELEASITFPDLEVVGFARQAQQKHGVQLALVSDTYFSEQQLRRLIDRPPFDQLDLSYVLTSSSNGTGKGQDLFAVLLERAGVTPSRILHVGDHPLSDCEAPRKAGIHAVHFDKFPAGLREVVDREHALRHTHPYQRLLRVTPEYGDFGLTALRAKSAWRWEADGADANVSPYWQFGATVLGPVFSGFAEWIHQRAAEEGVQRVFGLMREGEFLCRLIEGAKPQLHSDVSASPVYLSRRVCAAASVTSADEDELRGFLHRRRPPTVREYCEELGISAADLPEIGASASGRMDDPALREHVIQAIVARDDVRNGIVARSTAMRDRLVRSFMQTVGDPEGRPVLLVDLGWGATIQALLKRALEAAGVDISLLGLYLVTSEAAVDRMLDGVHAEGFLAAAGVPEVVSRWVSRSPEIIEQTCMVDMGSVVDFTPTGEPVLGDVNQSPTQQLQRNAIQRGITNFQDEWGRYRGVVPNERHSLIAARDQLRAMLTRFVLEPTAAEAAMFSTWSHDENFGSSQLEGVFVREVGHVLRHLTPDQFLALPMTRVYWPFGLAALHHSSLVSQSATVATGLLAGENFYGIEPLVVGIDVNLGDDDHVRYQIETRSNMNGLSYMRGEILHPVRSLRLEFGRQPAIVRLDSVRATFSLSGEAEPRELVANWPRDFRDFTGDQSVRLAANLLVGASDGPAVALPIPAAWQPRVYRVDVEVSFAVMRTAALRPRRSLVVHGADRLIRKVLQGS